MQRVSLTLPEASVRIYKRGEGALDDRKIWIHKREAETERWIVERDETRRCEGKLRKKDRFRHTVEGWRAAFL